MAIKKLAKVNEDNIPFPTWAYVADDEDDLEDMPDDAVIVYVAEPDEDAKHWRIKSASGEWAEND